MQNFASIDPDVARRLLDYDPETGELRWLERAASEPSAASFNARFAGKPAGHRHTCTVGKTYIQVRVAGRLHYAHRIAWVLMNGPIPDGMQVDHIDGDTGVYLDKRRGRYSARVWDNGRFLTLGHAGSAEEAYEIRQAYNRANGFHDNHGKDRPL